MFFSDSFVLPETLWIVPVEREAMSTKTDPRPFHNMAYRFLGDACMSDQNGDTYLKTGDILFIPSNHRYSTKSSAENLVAIHFTCSAHNDICRKDKGKNSSASHRREASDQVLGRYVRCSEKQVPSYKYCCRSY